MHQGKVFFEKKLPASSLPPHSTMTLPKLFVQQHGDKIQKYATLRNAANGKMWTVKINIMFYRNRPQACFRRGWKNFIASNDLVIGDQLTFVLVAKSLFHVFILRIGVNPGFSVPNPNLWSHNPSPAHRETKMSPVPQHGCKISADGCQKSENPLSGTWLAKNTAVETYVAKVASDSPDSSQSPSDMDSHYFEPMVQQMELECVSKAVNNSKSEQECINCHIAAMTKLGMRKTVGAGFYSLQRINVCNICSPWRFLVASEDALYSTWELEQGNT